MSIRNMIDYYYHFPPHSDAQPSGRHHHRLLRSGLFEGRMRTSSVSIIIDRGGDNHAVFKMNVKVGFAILDVPVVHVGDHAHISQISKLTEVIGIDTIDSYRTVHLLSPSDRFVVDHVRIVPPFCIPTHCPADHPRFAMGRRYGGKGRCGKGAIAVPQGRSRGSEHVQVEACVAHWRAGSRMIEDDRGSAVRGSHGKAT